LQGGRENLGYRPHHFQEHCSKLTGTSN
jgi:hypothetical protein